MYAHVNNKKLIRLTEADLHRIVKKSVNKVLKETANGQQFDPEYLIPVCSLRH